MILGMSQACYRWVIYPNMRRDRPDYYRDYPPHFLQSVIPPEPGADVEDWLIQKSLDLDLEVLYMPPTWGEDRQGADLFRDKMSRADIGFIGGVGLNMAASEEEWWGGEFEQAVKAVQRVAWGGGKLAAAVHSQSTRHNHFTLDPPVQAQIKRAIHNFSSLIPACEEHGVVLAVENHMDYRLAELGQIIEAVDSKWIRINLDTANPIALIEDPLEGALKTARYAVNAHLKDMRIQPATGTGEPRVFWAPLGQGDVPIAEILALLQEEAPNPRELPVCLEVAPPPDHDPDAWMRSSLDWLRSTCGTYFDKG